MTDDARDLARTAASLAACARRLDAEATSDSPPEEIERVRRTMHRIADDLATHASALRRLDDEIDLLSRRRDDGRELAELRRRRTHTRAAVRHALDDATRSLLPGGDVLDPATILRRLSGVDAPVRHVYFGRPPVDRAERVRRLTALLLRGPHHPGTAWPGPRAAVVTVPSRASRIARIRRHLRTRTTTRATTGERA